MENNVLMYKTVFDRGDSGVTDFHTVLHNEGDIFSKFGIKSYKTKLKYIKNIKTKEIRNHHKRTMLPVVKLYPAGILSIDIDNIYGDEKEISRLVDLLKELDTCRAIKGTPSGNLVAFFRFKCDEPKDFPYLYYKLYLELTLLLNVTIDFLPEVGRLRYISNGEVYHDNPESKVLHEILKVKQLPYITTKETGGLMEDEVQETSLKSKKKKKRRKKIYIYRS